MTPSVHTTFFVISHIYNSTKKHWARCLPKQEVTKRYRSLRTEQQPPFRSRTAIQDGREVSKPSRTRSLQRSEQVEQAYLQLEVPQLPGTRLQQHDQRIGRRRCRRVIKHSNV